MAIMTDPSPGLRAALDDLIGDLNTVRRVIIDIRPGATPVIHVERLGDERLIDVVRALDGVEITTHPQESDRKE